MRRTTVITVLAFAALLALPVLAKMKVMVQHQKGNDCKQYKTYEWLPTRTLRKNGIIDNDEKSTPAIKEVINRHLQAKGLVEVQSGGYLQVATAGQ